MAKDIHDIERRYATGLETFKQDARISQHNKELFLKFGEDCKIGFFGEPIGKSRLNKYVYHYKQVCLWLGKDIKKGEGLEEIKVLAKTIKESTLQFNTKRDYHIFIKKFWKWLNGEEWVMKNLKWLKTTTKFNEKTLPEDMPTEEEVLRLIESAKTIRDKFFLSFLYESGSRIGEAGSLKFKDLHINSGESEVKLKGKTGERVIPLFSCVPLGRQYLSNAPFKDDGNATVFNTGRNPNPMRYASLTKIIKKTAVRAEVKKHVHPHIFRHARLTWLAGSGNLNEAQLCAFAGWTMGSPQARTYVHLSQKNLRDSLRRVSVKESAPPEPVKSMLSPLLCRFCGLENSSNAGFCEKCGNGLTVEAISEEREKKAEALQALVHGQVTDEIASFLEQMGLKGINKNAKNIIKKVAK